MIFSTSIRPITALPTANGCRISGPNIPATTAVSGKQKLERCTKARIITLPTTALCYCRQHAERKIKKWLFTCNKRCDIKRYAMRCRKRGNILRKNSLTNAKTSYWRYSVWAKTTEARDSKHNILYCICVPICCWNATKIIRFTGCLQCRNILKAYSKIWCGAFMPMLFCT